MPPEIANFTPLATLTLAVAAVCLVVRALRRGGPGEECRCRRCVAEAIGDTMDEPRGGGA